ncbi:MAG: AAA family ATPase, partial [Psychrosphaera sp.]|nr:AAA family ATPase [Psychrosphaera sp.]
LTVPPIFPFGINPSQRQAVLNALTHQISLIQGPPGTGKTQTILNLIANLVLQGKSIAIVAGNNAATDNVLEKLKKNQFGFLAARLGSKKQQEKFFTEDHPIPDLSAWRLPHQQRATIQREFSRTSESIVQLLEARNQLAVVRELINNLATERQHFERNFAITPVNMRNTSFFNQWHSRALLRFMAEFEHYAQFGRISWPTRFLWLYRYRIYKFDDLGAFSGETLKGIVAEFYHQRTKELNDELTVLQQQLESHDFDNLLALQTSHSMKILQDHIAQNYQRTTTPRFNIKSYKKDFKQFLARFPVVLSTADSIINNKSTTELFDYLIVDEASQVNLLSGFLSMSCAKNMVVVGDLKQLPHIPDDLITKVHTTVDQQF